MFIDPQSVETFRHRVDIAGRVLCHDGSTVAGACVRLHRFDKSVDVRGPALKSTESNAGGLFWFLDLPAGRYQLTIDHLRTTPDRAVPLQGAAQVRCGNAVPPTVAQGLRAPFVDIELVETPLDAARSAAPRGDR
jgi:hypothetical protein